MKHRKNGKVWISVVGVHRAYGGPEEGGWYYNAGVQVIEAVRVTTERARAAIRLMTQRHDLDSRGRRWDWRTADEVYLTKTATRPEDQEFPRPRYE